MKKIYVLEIVLLGFGVFIWTFFTSLLPQEVQVIDISPSPTSPVLEAFYKSFTYAIITAVVAFTFLIIWARKSNEQSALKQHEKWLGVLWAAATFLLGGLIPSFMVGLLVQGILWLFQLNITNINSKHAFNVARVIFALVVSFSIVAILYSVTDPTLQPWGAIGILFSLPAVLFIGLCLSITIFVFIWAFTAYFNTQKQNKLRDTNGT